MTHPFEPVEIPLPDGSILRGICSSRENGSREQAAVIFAHGLGSTRGGEKAHALQAECGRRGWMFAAFDFRGHGQSGGNMLDVSASRLLEDIEAITRAVASRAAIPLFVFGSSMGGWASGWLGAGNPGLVSAFAFAAPAFRLLEWKKLRTSERDQWARTGRYRIHNEHIDMELGPGLLLEAKRYPLDKLLKHFRLPALIFHGMKDDLVPYTESIDFAARCASWDVELRLFRDGDHRLNLHKAEMARAACDFFARHLAPRQSHSTP